MTAIIVSLFIFLVSVAGIGLIITRKIPLVLETPREVVDDYFEQGSSRAHIRVLRIRSWVKQGAYWDPLLTFSARSLLWLRVVILKLDRYSFSLLQNVKEKTEKRKANQVREADPRYWDELKSSSSVDTRKDGGNDNQA